MLCASLGVCAQLKRSESSNPPIGSCDTQPGPRALGLDGLSSRHSEGPIANASLSSEIGNRELNLLEQVCPGMGSPLKGSKHNYKNLKTLKKKVRIIHPSSVTLEL